MSEPVRRVVLGDVARLQIDRVKVVPANSYRMAGVYNEGQGVFARGEVLGRDTSYPNLHRLAVGLIVMRKLTGWEGSIAVVGQEHAGMFVSTEFPTFVIDTGRLRPDYMALLCRWPAFWQEMKLRATGTVQRRKRVSPEALLSIPIVLPELDQQRRIVDLVCALDESAGAARVVQERSTASWISLAEDLWKTEAVERVPLYTVASRAFGGRLHDGDWVESKDQSPRDRESIRLLQLADIGRGEFLNKSDRWISPEAFRALHCTEVKPGDLLLSRMAEPAGRTAIVPDLPTRAVTVVDASILRLGAGNHPNYWLALLNSPTWLQTCADRAGGSTRSRITRRNLEAIEVPCPSQDEQARLGELLGALNREGIAAGVLAERVRLAQAAVLTDLLSGEHEIPASYDALLEAV